MTIQIDDYKILVDPAMSVNPKAVEKDKEHYKDVDYILVTHAHNDHVADVEQVAAKTGATIIANYEIANHYGSKGHESHGMNHGGTMQFPFGELKCVLAVHSSHFEDGSGYGGHPCGFVIVANGKNIYIAGDTALTMDMKLIPLFYDLDLAVLPLGDNYTMGIKEAVMASQFVEVNEVLGCHYDTFPILEIDHNKALKAFETVGKKLHLLDIGQTIKL